MLGMSISVFDIEIKGKKIQGVVCGIAFLVLSVCVYVMDVNIPLLSFLLGLLACIAVILLIAGFEDKFGRKMNFLAKYTMPVFLMHTLFAAPVRSVLLKIGITNPVLHVLLGISISFIGPIVAAWIMKKTKWLEFFIYPTKVIMLINTQRKTL